MRVLSLVVATLALLVALGGEALASECHKNCNGGYLAMTALVAGSLAVGSAALGTRVGGSSLKRVEHADADAGTSAATSRVEDVAPARDIPPADAPRADAPAAAAEPATLRDAHERVPATASAADPAAAPVADTGANVVRYGSEYAGRVAKEMAPHGGTIDSGLGVAQKVIANEDRVAGLAEGLTDAAVEEVKDVVKDATKATTPPSPSVGATVRYCPSCGTKAREGAHFCAQCGTRLG